MTAQPHGTKPNVNQTTQDRRTFLQWILRGGFTALLAAILYPVFRFLIPPKTVEANVSQVKLPFTRADIEAEPQKYKIFKFGRELGIVFIAPDGRLDALSATCTHLSCTVQYRPDWQVIWCACHNGKYDLNGNNISGPPPKPLEKFSVNVVNDAIIVSKDA
jgi:cytochrome b6-f complex iron-sulfur subunit